MKKAISIIITVFGLMQAFGQHNFDAKKLLVLSDADMAASAYLDGKLKLVEGDEDVLTSVDLSQFPEEVEISTLQVSNSVTNWTKSLEITADGKVAFVAETRGPIERDKETVNNVFEDLPAGRLLTAANIENGLEIIDTIDVGNIPLVAQLSPDGKWLATAIEEPGREIVLVPWANNQFGQPRYFSTSKSPEEKIRATDLSWHPSGNYLAVTLEESTELAFYEVNSDRSRVNLIGEPVEIGLLPGAGQFTPDGKFYLIPDIDDWVTPGFLLSIQPGFHNGNHGIISKVELGRAPEGFGISPDGTKVLVANMEGSHFPYGNDFWTKGSSLSLLTLSADGKLNEVDRKRFSGILPESISFDADGDMAAVAVYDYNDPVLKKGAVELWEIHGDKLVPSTFKISATRGAHVLKLVY